jgi:hypothetical protein
MNSGPVSISKFVMKLNTPVEMSAERPSANAAPIPLPPCVP